MSKLPNNGFSSFANNRYFFTGLTSTIALLTGTIFYHYAEGLRWLDALYFSVITLTTVGYGDFSPQTDIGKVFTIIYILVGIGIIFSFINAFYEKRMKKMNERQDKTKSK